MYMYLEQNEILSLALIESKITIHVHYTTFKRLFPGRGEIKETYPVFSSGKKRRYPFTKILCLSNTITIITLMTEKEAEKECCEKSLTERGVCELAWN